MCFDFDIIGRHVNLSSLANNDPHRTDGQPRARSSLPDDDVRIQPASLVDLHPWVRRVVEVRLCDQNRRATRSFHSFISCTYHLDVSASHRLPMLAVTRTLVAFLLLLSAAEVRYGHVQRCPSRWNA